jgi:hypothetical protein
MSALNPTPPKPPKIANVKWLVKYRSANQWQTLRLYEGFRKYDKFLSHPDNIVFLHQGFALVSAAFALWRAVFLTRQKAGAEPHVTDATSFLELLVEDNMIGYPQDKKTREFTFVFYLNTARLHLEEADASLRGLFTMPGRAGWVELHERLAGRVKRWRTELKKAGAFQAPKGHSS